jgi:hypothetical protein
MASGTDITRGMLFRLKNCWRSLWLLLRVATRTTHKIHIQCTGIQRNLTKNTIDSGTRSFPHFLAFVENIIFYLLNSDDIISCLWPQWQTKILYISMTFYYSFTTN